MKTRPNGWMIFPIVLACHIPLWGQLVLKNSAFEACSVVIALTKQERLSELESGGIFGEDLSKTPTLGDVESWMMGLGLGIESKLTSTMQEMLAALSAGKLVVLWDSGLQRKYP